MKKIFLIVFLLSVSFAIYKYGFLKSNNPDSSKSIQTTNKIKVKQKIGNDKTTFYQLYEIEGNQTALDLLKQSSSVVTKGGRENAYVIEINGRKADDSKKEFWSFYVNGKMSLVGAGSYLLKNGDKIEWKIETY